MDTLPAHMSAIIVACIMLARASLITLSYGVGHAEELYRGVKHNADWRALLPHISDTLFTTTKRGKNGRPDLVSRANPRKERIITDNGGKIYRYTKGPALLTWINHKIHTAHELSPSVQVLFIDDQQSNVADVTAELNGARIANVGTATQFPIQILRAIMLHTRICTDKDNLTRILQMADNMQDKTTSKSATVWADP